VNIPVPFQTVGSSKTRSRPHLPISRLRALSSFFSAHTLNFNRYRILLSLISVVIIISFVTEASAQRQEVFGLPWLKKKKRSGPKRHWSRSSEFVPSYQLPWQKKSKYNPKDFVDQEDLREAEEAESYIVKRTMNRTYEDMDYAVIDVLDKFTSKTKRIKAKVGEAVKFGWISILPRAAKKTPPNEEPEVAVFLDVVSEQPKKEPQKIFSGYMYASSPSVSKLEHPLYDIQVYDAINEAKKVETAVDDGTTKEDDSSKPAATV
jgi:hypothetical protein